MAGLETALNECVHNIRSTKLTERKKGTENLRNYLQQEDVVKLIDIRSVQTDDSLISWDSIFQACHNSLHQAAEKMIKDGEIKARSANENTIKTNASLMTLVVSKANSNDQNLNCRKVIRLSLEVLEDARFRKIIGERYIRILNDFILPFRIYWSKIQELWSELYLISLKIYEETIPGCNPADVISMLNIIIKHGCDHSCLLLAIKKDIFGFMEKVMKTAAASKETDHYKLKVLTLLVTVCQKLQKECRIAVCKFGEDVLESILPLYPAKTSLNEIKKLIFDFLLIIVEAHYPNGVDESSPAAYANDLTLWKRQLQRMNTFASSEITNVLRYEKSGTLYPSFVKLNVHVYKQHIHSDFNSLDVTMQSNLLNESFQSAGSSKKMRMTVGFPGLIDRLNDVNKFSDMWPWLHILYELLSTYPTLVKENDYVVLLEQISKFLSTSKDSLVTDYLCKCCIELINIRNCNNSYRTLDENTLESIWRTVLSTIGLNQSIEWSHRLLQHMMNHLWKPSRGQTILKLYLSGVIRLTNHSLFTLYLLRKRISFPDNLLEIEVWSSLMQWMSPKDPSIDFISNADLQLYAHTLVLLCLKNNVKNNDVVVNVLEIDTRPSTNSISAADIFILMSYESEIILESDETKEPSSEETKHPICVRNDEAANQLIDFLKNSFELLCETYVDSDYGLEAFENLSRFNVLLLHVQKFFIYYGIPFNFNLEDFSQRLTNRLVNIVINIFKSNETCNRLDFLVLVSQFFKQLGTLPKIVVDPVLVKCFQSLIGIFDIIRSNVHRTVDQDDVDMEVKVDDNETSISLFDFKLLSYEDKLKVEACRALLYYSYNHEFTHDSQYKLLMGIFDELDELGETLTSLCLLQMAVPTIQTALQVKKFDSDIADKIVILIQAISNKWYSFEESALVILKIVQKTITKAQNIAKKLTWDSLKHLIEVFATETKSYGPAVVSEVVRCWGLLLKVRCGLQNITETDELVEICDKILSYLKHDFHEVRVTAVVYLPEIFKFIDEMYESTGMVLKDTILGTFRDNLWNLFQVTEEMRDNKTDEATIRPVVVLYSFANAISFSQCARRGLLLMLFNFTHEKRLNQSLVFKILNLVKKKLHVDSVMHLVHDNSVFLLWKWFEKYKTFENFPFQDVKCPNEKSFYEECLPIIIPILSFYGETDKISEIATKLEISLSDLTQKYFPEIMALFLYKVNCNVISASETEGISRDEMYENLETALAPKEFLEMMTVKLTDTLIELFRNLHDPNFEISPNSILPLPAPCRSDEKLISAELDTLQGEFQNPDIPLVILITSDLKDTTQKIMQQLYIDVINASTSELKLESFQKYRLFCGQLLPYYDDLVKSRMACFVCRTIVTNLLHFVSHDGKNLPVSLASLKFLRYFASTWLSADENKRTVLQVVKDFIGGVVDDLVFLGLQTDELGSQAIETLELLLKSISALQTLLNMHCVNLESFPELAQFDNLNVCFIQMADTQVRDTTLTDTLTKGTDLDIDIKKFLSIVEKSNKCRIESLRCLKNQLSDNRDELKKFFKRLISKRVFSEECAISLPHRLICSLLQLTSSEDEKIKYEAACCLGEIGLVDLHSLVLKPNCDKYDASSKAETLITVQLCHMLQKCLIEKDVDVIVAASEAAYAILMSPEGLEIKNELKTNGEYYLLYPFIEKEPSSHELWHYFDIEAFKRYVDQPALWSPEINITFESWIENLTCSILVSFKSPCYLNVLRKICQIKATFAEEIFKFLINLILKCKSEHSNPATEILSNCINKFFKNHYDTNENDAITDSWSSSRSGTDSILDIHRNKRAVQCLLDVVHFIRLKQNEPDLNELKLNYLYAAKAAQFCSLHFTSVLYVELWIISQIKDYNIENDGNLTTVLEGIANKTPEYKDEPLNILREAFSKIGDSDALCGCSSSILLQTRSRIVHYAQTENWPRVMQQCDVFMSSSSQTPSYSDINDLSSAIGLAGFSYLQSQYLSSVHNLNPALKDLCYEGCWKLGKWDLPEPSDDEKTFAYYQYATLKDIKQGNILGAEMNIENARKILTPVLSRTCLESTKNIYNVLSKLQCLQDIEVYLKSMDNIDDVIRTWKSQDEFNIGINFKNKEIILYQRLCMLPENNVAACEFILDTAKLARKKSNPVFADRCLEWIKPLAEVTSIFQMQCDLEEAKGLWCRQETDTARYILQNLLKREELKEAKPFHSKLLRIYGSWLSDINLENADNIYNNYFKPATEKLKNRTGETEKERKSRLKTYKCVGEFADSQYQQIHKYMKSNDFKRHEENVQLARLESNALDGSTEDNRRTKAQLVNQSKIDQSLVTETGEKKDRYLLLAMEYYLRWLMESDDDLRMFRVISLFVENKGHGNLNLLIRKLLFKVPSYKFIIVLPQLSAHITRDSAQAFGNSVKTVIEICARDHPHHTLPFILSLAKYVKDEEHKEKSDSSSKVIKEERVLAACEFMKRFCKDIKIGEIARQMEAISDAYIELAYYRPENKNIPGETVTIRSSFLIGRLTNLDQALCPTINLPVSKIADYKEITGIRRIEMKYSFVGGVNAPKKITCLGTGGEIVHQLVKGRDDIRQDAVMQQVFTIMNKLLSMNKHTSKRKLLIRTYKVVPLSQRSGILEWCSNTMSLGDYLVERGGSNHPGAHKKYRPQDINPNNARSKIHTCKKSDQEKLRVYKEICKRLKPVFRYFFLEKFPSPTMWFERKLAYTHSVAVTSIVGYIIGLGDRHVQNILIDEKTAEVIHIDFGIAFDQGLLLNFPERVPFRLTRDVEDGMGVFSIDGIFRKCCEQTLTVMRQNKNIIQTTLEVFLYDPLYQWTVTPEKKASVQKMPVLVSGTEVNLTAPRALAGVISKLQGLDEGAYTTIEGQVNRLIQQAKDPNNLSRLYSGWQAYL